MILGTNISITNKLELRSELYQIFSKNSVKNLLFPIKFLVIILIHKF